MSIAFSSELCAYCGGCVSLCPSGALALAETHLVVAGELCTDCELCVRACPTGALLKKEEKHPLSLVPRRYDLVVVGAGPAGSVAARVAAERGLDVLCYWRSARR